jgi:hypothetical protein
LVQRYDFVTEFRDSVDPVAEVIDPAWVILKSAAGRSNLAG